jgi:hypothetical protein
LKEPRIAIRYKPEELSFYKKLAEIMGVDDVSTALRLLAKERLENSGVAVPEGFLGKRPEGRPKEDRQEAMNQLAVSSAA